MDRLFFLFGTLQEISSRSKSMKFATLMDWFVAYCSPVQRQVPLIYQFWGKSINANVWLLFCLFWRIFLLIEINHLIQFGSTTLIHYEEDWTMHSMLCTLSFFILFRRTALLIPSKKSKKTKVAPRNMSNPKKKGFFSKQPLSGVFAVSFRERWF